MASRFLRQYVFNKRTVYAAAATTTLTTAGGYYYLNYVGPTYPPSALETRRAPQPWTPPPRDAMLERLKAAAKEGGEFDLLVVGGGATGAGVAVDAATRGLKVALVERDDFSSGKIHSSFRLSHILMRVQVHLPSPPNSSTEVFVICRRRSWNSITNSINWLGKLYMSAKSSCKQLRI